MKTPIDLVLIGGGGHAKAVIDIIRSLDTYRIVGITDRADMVGNDVLGIPIIGEDSDLPQIRKTVGHAFIGLGSYGSNIIRKKCYNNVLDLGFECPNIISPFAYVSATATIGAGSLIMHKAVVNVDAKIAENNVVQTMALVEHEAAVGSHNYISTGAILNGMTTIGENVYFGSNATLNQTLHICDNVIVGSNSAVVRSIEEPGTYVGIPAKRLK